MEIVLKFEISNKMKCIAHLRSEQSKIYAYHKNDFASCNCMEKRSPFSIIFSLRKGLWKMVNKVHTSIFNVIKIYQSVKYSMRMRCMRYVQSFDVLMQTFQCIISCHVFQIFLHVAKKVIFKNEMKKNSREKYVLTCEKTPLIVDY